MNRALFLGSVALAFVAGATGSRLLPAQQARAANELTPMLIHVPELQVRHELPVGEERRLPGMSKTS